MYKLKHLWLLLAIICVGLVSCEDDDPQLPQYGEITITPVQQVYHVGDVITCSITEEKAPEAGLKKATYWWYASTWFNNPDLMADFKEFDDSKKCTSSEITLQKAGEITLYFFGRLEYPNFDFRKVEIAKTITVTE